MMTVFLLAAGTRAVAQEDPLARVSRWSVSETWNKDDLVYTFSPNGTFTSSSGKRGTWLREGSALLMRWPSYQALYLATVAEGEIRGRGFWDKPKDKSTFGTFVFKLLPESR
jgi:hypothetical protein